MKHLTNMQMQHITLAVEEAASRVLGSRKKAKFLAEHKIDFMVSASEEADMVPESGAIAYKEWKNLGTKSYPDWYKDIKIEDFYGPIRQTKCYIIVNGAHSEIRIKKDNFLCVIF